MCLPIRSPSPITSRKSVKEYGMDHLDLFNPETYKFVDGLFKEYLEGKNPVFRGKVVHINR